MARILRNLQYNKCSKRPLRKLTGAAFLQSAPAGVFSISMNYLSLSFAALTAVTFLLYYLLPLQKRWTALLSGSAVFYILACRRFPELLLFLLTVIFSYVAASLRTHRIPALLLTALPLAALKCAQFAGISSFPRSITDGGTALLVPVGLSFYTLTMISYMVDVYRGKIQPQKSFPRYALYISFFPQIVQGPIPRYAELSEQLFTGHRFRLRQITDACKLIVWGLFLKYMIADKAAGFVSAVFDAEALPGWQYALLGGCMYSLQLYADFDACVCLCQGTAGLFGIRLAENFHHPYFAGSVKEFWRRWHISLSTWLRDYVYIPLGGSRRGKARTRINLLITFLVSGFWHGSGVQFLFWGLIHGSAQILEGMCSGLRDTQMPPALRKSGRLLHRILALFVIMMAWIIFRAKTLKRGLLLWKSILTLEGGSTAFRFQADFKELFVLLLSACVLLIVSLLQERLERRNLTLRNQISGKALPVRLLLYSGVIMVILIFGTWGYGYQAQDFIYGEF